MGKKAKARKKALQQRRKAIKKELSGMQENAKKVILEKLKLEVMAKNPRGIMVGRGVPAAYCWRPTVVEPIKHKRMKAPMWVEILEG